MTSAPPLWYEWNGEAMVPLRRHHNVCNAYFVVGQRYRLEEQQERSLVSHNHQFAWLHSAWMNLPEDLASEYPSPDHLRKRALIQAGFYTEQIIDAGSNAAALRVAALLRSRGEFSLIIVRGAIVVIRDAMSQSTRAMGAKEFQRSKSAIMDIIAEMIGVTADALAKEGKAA